MNGYVCFYNGKRVEVYAKTTLAAQQEAARLLKVKANKTYMISVWLAEKPTPDGETETVVHTADF